MVGAIVGVMVVVVVIGVVVGVDFDHGQNFDAVDGAAGLAGAAGAAGAGRRVAMDAGLAMTVEAAKPSALTAAGIDLRQAVCMAVLLDFVDRRHPCQRLSGSIKCGIVLVSWSGRCPMYVYCAVVLEACMAGNTGAGMLCRNLVFVASTIAAGRLSEARYVPETCGGRPSMPTCVAYS